MFENITLLENAGKALRIVTIARKPDREEFERIAKITGAGMLGIGLIGALILLAFKYI